MALTKIGLKIVKDSFRTSFSGSFRGELSSSASTFVGGGISGSSISTGSFGRVEAAGVVFADSFKSVTGGTAIDFNDDISLTGNLTATGNVSGSITSTGSFGRVNSTTIDIDSIQGNWTNAGNTVADLGIITTADINGGTIDGITLGTNSAITEAQIDSVNINGSTIKDFSSVSGSSVSTGSFGRVITSTADINGGTIDGITSLTAGGDLDIGAHGFRASTLTSDSQTSGRVAIYSTAGLLSEDSDLTFSGATLSATNVTTTGTIKDFASVSGSYVSTGSVGRLETQQTNASLGGSIINLTGNLTTAGTLTTQNNNVTINAAGAARTLTLNESLTVGDGHDGILTYSAASKTLTVENTSVVNQDLTSDASPTFAGGTVTGNLSVGGIFTAQEVHTEFESASVLFTSGSTRFGNDTTDIHRVTGSMDISGSLKLPHGDVTITDTLTATNIGAFNLTGKLTAGSTEIEGSAFDINGGTIDGITSLTAGGDLDIGAHDLRAATITADSLTATRVPFAGTAGVLSDDADLTFATATLSATNLTTTGTIKNMALVSGSSVSTGSFGHITLSEGLEIGGVFKASLSNNDAGTSNTIFGKNAGLSLDAGSNQNVFIGENVSDAAMDDAGDNVGIGHSALSALTTGDDNVGIGSGAGAAISTGLQNTAVGKNALLDLNTGKENIAVGRNSGENLTTSSGSVFIGWEAGATSVTGNRNIGIGRFAMGGGATTGDNNIAIGANAGDALTSGYQNVLIGQNAGGQLTTAKENVIIGGNAFTSANTSENFNVIIGYNAAAARDGGDSAVAIGHSALATMVAVAGNTAVGFEAGKITTGGDNTYVGFKAGKGASGAETSNVGIGSSALHGITSGDSNVAVGFQAGTALTDGDFNVAMGFNALVSMVSGDRNTAIGYKALTDSNADAANQNTALGYKAGHAISNGVDNTCLGQNTGGNDVNLTTGDQNVIIGSEADVSTADAQNQIAIGYDTSGQGNNTAVIGNDSCTAFYASSDAGATGHFGGMAIGLARTDPITALDVHSAGSEVAAVFGMADDGNAIVSTRVGEVQNRLGAYAFMVGSAAVDGIGSANTTAYITSTVKNDGGALQGDIQFFTNAGDDLGAAEMTIEADGSIQIPGTLSVQGITETKNLRARDNNAYDIGTSSKRFKEIFATNGTINTSDARLKESIEDSALGLDFLNKHRPVSFNWKDIKENGTLDKKQKHYGFIAQEVEQVLVDSNISTQDFAPLIKSNLKDDNEVETGENIYGIRYDEYIGILVKAVQELTKRIEELEN